jgi:hypothetical protein
MLGLLEYRHIWETWTGGGIILICTVPISGSVQSSNSAWVELIDRAQVQWVLALTLRTAVFKGHNEDRGAQWIQ